MTSERRDGAEGCGTGGPDGGPPEFREALRARGMRVVDYVGKEPNTPRVVVVSGPPKPPPASSGLLGADGKPLESQPARACGACSACCTTLGVPRGIPGLPEGRKAPHTRCQHQSPAGCGVYAERPSPCRTYRCAWLEGQWGEGERPDRLGVIFDAVSGAVVAREVFRGGFQRARAKARLTELVRLGLHVRLVPFKGRKLPVGKPL